MCRRTHVAAQLLERELPFDRVELHGRRARTRAAAAVAAQVQAGLVTVKVRVSVRLRLTGLGQ